ncbi:L-tyrosine/L-tryptophan isonitrile synthase family protein [Pendulispora brunnea]|uniref:L-tyrosine/L-tryptophan isonitrile synthase family protein n=1 Tax=Pendulispora brunnea TaxID=2905690 RepID=A0ABZ2K1H6_9BACT
MIESNAPDSSTASVELHRSNDVDEDGLSKHRSLRSLQELLITEPTLRMHCALLAPFGSLWPWHPRHPSGTRAVSLEAWAKTRAAEGLSWRDFVECFVRPFVKTTRIALERHGVALFGGDGEPLMFEMAPDGRATGRVVVGRKQTFGGRESLDALRTALANLGEAFRRTAGGRAPSFDVERAVLRAAMRELRFLEPRAAAALSADPVLRGLVHTIAPEQDALLRGVLQRVEDLARRRAADRTLRKPAVVFDLDLCALIPRARTLLAARQVALPQPGAPQGISELLEPERLDPLPVHHEAGWFDFLERHRLPSKYPALDWAGLRARFEMAYYRPWENLRLDEVLPGIATFVHDIVQAGGEVVFSTGRRDRVRAQTEYVLARAGILHATLLTMPDDRTRPVAELKVEQVRALTDLEVVAFFDDLVANRAAMAAAFPSAMVIAARIPGFAGEPADAAAPQIATFETAPRVRTATRGVVPAPLDAQSISKLALAELQAPVMAADHAVHLSLEQSRAIVDRLVARAELDAERTAAAARAALQVGPGPASDVERTVRLLHHVLTRKQFCKGPRGHYPIELAMRDMAPHVERHVPVHVVILGFPIKHCESALKAFGPLPDFAELGALVRLRELELSVRRLYAPGLRLTVLTDGQHYRPRTQSLVDAYLDRLHAYLGWIGGERIAFRDIDELAEATFGPGTRAHRQEVVGQEEHRLRAALEGLSVEENPLRTLRAAAERNVDSEHLTFQELFLSLVHSVPIPPPPPDTPQIAWSKSLYEDLFHLEGPEAVCEARRRLLTTAWEHSIRYMASVRANALLRYYGEPFDVRVRMGVVPRAGRLGISLLGGSTLLPWHGTGCVDARGYVSTEFAISLLDQGFVPVHSPLLQDQPWMMVPITATRVPAPGRPAELLPAFIESIRLRRK